MGVTVFATPYKMASYNHQDLLDCMSKDADYDSIKDLLENGSDPLEGDIIFPLQLAIKLKSCKLIQLMLPYCQVVRLKAKSSIILHYGCTYGSVECVQLLMEAGLGNYDLLNTLTNERTPLLSALLKQNYDIAGYLLENGADPNISNLNGTYPVHLAAKYGNMNLLYKLESHGAVFNVQDNQGNTPLHFVSHPSVVEFLILQGNVNPAIR